MVPWQDRVEIEPMLLIEDPYDPAALCAQKRRRLEAGLRTSCPNEPPQTFPVERFRAERITMGRPSGDTEFHRVRRPSESLFAKCEAEAEPVRYQHPTVADLEALAK